MGATRVNVTVRNPAEPERAWEGVFLVDTGAFHSVVPRKHLEAIGLTPEGRRRYGMADGRVETFDVALAKMEIMDHFAGGHVIFGSDNAEPLLGCIALEDAGMEVDPVGGRLKPQQHPRHMVGIRPAIE